MSREALQLSFGGPNALEAFAAVLLGERPSAPSNEAVALAAMARGVASDRARRRFEPAEPRDERAEFRAVYHLARDRAAAVRRAPQPSGPETKASLALRLMLSLRHRQRAALALRFVLRAGVDDVAFVLGISRDSAEGLIRAGLSSVTRAGRSKMDVRRHLRAAGVSLPAPAFETPAEERPVRGVVQLLLGPVPSPPPPSRRRRRIATSAHAIYARGLTSTRAHPQQLLLDHGRRRSAAPVFAAVAAVLAVAVAVAVAPGGVRPVRDIPIAALPLAPETGPTAVAPSVRSTSSMYTIKPGDTLWTIAAVTLGDPHRWKTIWLANAGRLMIDGNRFSDPDLILPGWRLRILALRGG